MSASVAPRAAPEAQLRPVVDGHEYMDVVSRRQVPAASPALAAPSPAAADGIARTPDGAIILPLAMLERLRGLQAAYQSAVDTVVTGYGLPGGCGLELGRGLLWPPGTRPATGAVGEQEAR